MTLRGGGRRGGEEGREEGGGRNVVGSICYSTYLTVFGVCLTVCRSFVKKYTKLTLIKNIRNVTRSPFCQKVTNENDKKYCKPFPYASL